jgi:hypothetical protein
MFSESDRLLLEIVRGLDRLLLVMLGVSFGLILLKNTAI